MYKSPIDMFVTDIQHQIAEQQDEQIYKAIVSVGINVDKEELIRALAYDRHQYARGHLDGEADAMASLVRCKDCKHFDSEKALRPGGIWCGYWGTDPDPDDFCCKGERKDNEC